MAGNATKANAESDQQSRSADDLKKVVYSLVWNKSKKKGKKERKKTKLAEGRKSDERREANPPPPPPPEEVDNTQA